MPAAGEHSGEVPLLICYGPLPDGLPPTRFLIHIAATEYRQKAPRLTTEDVGRLLTKTGGLPIPYLFSGESEPLAEVRYRDEKTARPLITAGQGRVHCAADLMAGVFYLLSLENERRAEKRDRLNRFQRSDSPVGETIYEQPLVDLTADWLRGVLQEAAEQTGLPLHFAPRWPEEKRFALGLSHDVDRLQSWTLAKARRALARKPGPGQLLRILGSAARPDNWSGNFRFITRLEQNYSGRSSFFFCGKQREAMDPRYSLNSRHIRRGISHLRTQGWAIGLHGSISSALNSGHLAEEKAALETVAASKVTGNRQHYLRFSGAQTLRALEATDFGYDTTLGFSENLGYRCGTGFPFHPWDAEQRRPYGFLELPLILMDTVLLLESKLRLRAEEAWPVVEAHLQTARDLGGCLVVNWHSNNLSPADVTGYTELYEKMLNWARDQQAWITAPDQIRQWWVQKRNKGKDAENT